MPRRGAPDLQASRGRAGQAGASARCIAAAGSRQRRPAAEATRCRRETSDEDRGALLLRACSEAAIPCPLRPSKQQGKGGGECADTQSKPRSAVLARPPRAACLPRQRKRNRRTRSERDATPLGSAPQDSMRRVASASASGEAGGAREQASRRQSFGRAQLESWSQNELRTGRAARAASAHTMTAASAAIATARNSSSSKSSSSSSSSSSESDGDGSRCSWRAERPVLRSEAQPSEALDGAERRAARPALAGWRICSHARRRAGRSTAAAASAQTQPRPACELLCSAEA